MLVLASWNAIPGDSLYSLKTSLENVTLAALSGTPLLPKASIKFTDRRMNEATTLLSKKGSTVGYDLLVANAEQTQTFIAENGDVQSATQFSDNIDLYKKQIQETKAKVVGETTTQQQAPTTSQTSKALTTTQTQTNSTNNQTVVINVPTTVTIQHEDPKEVVQKLDETEQKLNEIQKKIKEKQGHENQGKDNNQGNQSGKDNNGKK